MSARLTALFVALSLAAVWGSRPALADPPAAAAPNAGENGQAADKDKAADTNAGENAGQNDLDRAVETKLAAEGPKELAEVIALCEQALDKGLDASNTEFAEKLLASALFQRGRMITEVIFTPPQPDPRWPQMRQLALHDLTRSVKLVSEQPQVYMLIGRLESLPGGDAKRALTAIEDAIRTAGDDSELKFDALMLHAGMDDSPQHRLKDLDEATKLNPQDPMPLRLRGSLKLSMGKRDEALADFDAAIKLDPKNAATYEIRGMALALLKRMDEARESYAHAVELAPKSPALLLQRAQVNYLTEKFDAAIADVTQALKLDPDNAAALLLRAQALARTDKSDEALADVDQVLKRQPNLPPALRTRAVILASTGKIDEAIRDLTRVYSQEPEDAEAAFQLAMLYRNKKNFTKALELINAAIDADPKNWFVFYGRGDLYLGMGKHREALADYATAYKQNSEDSGLLNNYAWLLATTPDEKLRDGKRAIELATKACKLTDYKASHILSTLAAGYAETGDYETAKKWSAKAVEVAGNDTTREQLKKELASYEARKPWRELLQEDTVVTQVPDDSPQKAKSNKEAAKPATDPNTVR
ncbi:MAG TPA: tetratricopeptide repeat protein [Pirellulales bacterium]|jgi:tetratricopeptide (TPR) repeat protein|nr:tetratricopeptide repeat protein [Pirellulales bacterium]